MKPKVLVADDHVVVLEAVGQLLCEDTELLGRVSDGRQLVESARRLRPDIIVTDVAMPVMSGLDAMRQLIAEHSTAKFIVLTAHADRGLAARAMAYGASGFLVKQSAGEELLDAVRAVMAGRVYVTRFIGATQGA